MTSLKRPVRAGFKRHCPRMGRYPCRIILAR